MEKTAASIRFMSSRWVTPVTFTEGAGFTGHDTLVVRQLNAEAGGDKDTPPMAPTIANARKLIAQEYGDAVTELAPDPVAEVVEEKPEAAPTKTDAAPISATPAAL